jgi:hypothetical protein
MTRQILSLARVPVFLTIAAAVAIAILPGRRDLVLDIYVLALATFAVGVLVVRVHRANPVAATSPFERAVRGRANRPERLADLERVEREVTLARQSAADVHFRLRPRVRPIAARLLFARRGIDLDHEPEAARRALGDDLWELVRSDREAPRRRDAPGLTPAETERLVAALERL